MSSPSQNPDQQQQIDALRSELSRLNKTAKKTNAGVNFISFVLAAPAIIFLIIVVAFWISLKQHGGWLPQRRGIDKFALLWFFICLNANGVSVSIYRGNGSHVAAWMMPPSGKTADEAMPGWLAHLIQAGVIVFTSAGGLSYQDLACIPGDYVLLTEDGQIKFCPADEFTLTYERLALSHAA
jgi:hypothetical protein